MFKIEDELVPDKPFKLFVLNFPKTLTLGVVPFSVILLVAASNVVLRPTVRELRVLPPTLEDNVKPHDLEQGLRFQAPPFAVSVDRSRQPGR